MTVASLRSATLLLAGRFAPRSLSETLPAVASPYANREKARSPLVSSMNISTTSPSLAPGTKMV